MQVNYNCRNALHLTFPCRRCENRDNKKKIAAKVAFSAMQWLRCSPGTADTVTGVVQFGEIERKLLTPYLGRAASESGETVGTAASLQWASGTRLAGAGSAIARPPRRRPPWRWRRRLPRRPGLGPYFRRCLDSSRTVGPRIGLGSTEPRLPPHCFYWLRLRRRSHWQSTQCKPPRARPQPGPPGPQAAAASRNAMMTV